MTPPRLTRTAEQWRALAEATIRLYALADSDAAFHHDADRAADRGDTAVGDFYHEHARLLERVAEHAREHARRWFDYADDIDRQASA